LALPAAQADGIQDPHLWHAHNVFLDVALELGLVGLAIFVAGLAAIGRQFARGLDGSDARRVAAIAGLVVMIGFVAKNFPDDFVVRHIALACAALAGMLTRAMRWPDEAPRA
jgi:O-antigen ligase